MWEAGERKDDGEMKTWQMIKALTENPNYIFRNAHNSVMISKISKRIVWVPDSDNEEESPFIIYSSAPGGVDNLHIEWDLVQEPVDFMTAINSGKRIRPEGHTLFYAAEEWCSKGLNHALINGKWYIASFGAEAR